MVRNRSYVIFASLLFVTMLMGACGKEQKKSATVLNVSFSLAESEWEVFRSKIFPDFEKRHDCQVEAVQINAADLPKLLHVGRLAKKSPVDVFAQDNMELAILVKGDLVEDLSHLEKTLPKEIYPSMFEAGRFEGRLYFLPFRPNVQIFYYNKAKFDEHGLTPPQSWDEWLEVAKTFYEKEGVGRVLIKGFGGGPTVTQMYEYIVAAGGDPFAFDDEGSKRTFAFMQKLWKVASPDSKKAKWDTSNDYLARDSVYLMQNWPFGYKIITEKYGKKGIKVYHGFPGPVREAHVIGGDVFGIPVGSQKKDLAFHFIEYMLSKEVQSILVNELGWPSVRVDAFEESPSPAFQAIKEALQYGIFRKNVSYWAEYQKLFEEAFLRIVINGEDLALLDGFHQRMQEIIRKYE